MEIEILLIKNISGISPSTCDLLYSHVNPITTEPPHVSKKFKLLWCKQSKKPNLFLTLMLQVQHLFVSNLLTINDKYINYIYQHIQVFLQKTKKEKSPLMSHRFHPCTLIAQSDTVQTAGEAELTGPVFSALTCPHLGQMLWSLRSFSILFILRLFFGMGLSYMPFFSRCSLLWWIWAPCWSWKEQSAFRGLSRTCTRTDGNGRRTR